MTTALVTGGNRGLGFEVARGLAREGMRVLLGARDAEAGERAAAQIRSEGHDATAIALDVTSSASVAEAAERIAAEAGRLDVLVNNAGILPEARHASAPDFARADVAEETFRTNVIGAIAVTEAVLPLLRRSAAGRIVNVSSTMGSLSDQADPDSPYYSTIVPAYQASKAALNSLTISLAKSLRDTPVIVSSVCPGFVQTELTPMNREHAPTTAEEAAQVVVRGATLPDGAPSGTFFSAAGSVAW